MTQPETTPTEGQQAADWIGPHIFLNYRPTRAELDSLEKADLPGGYMTSCGYCSAIEPFNQPVWQSLFPQTRFYRITLTGWTALSLRGGTRQVMVAWQAGQGYRVETFDQLLQVNQLTVSPNNRLKVAQAFILMALPDYLSHEFHFGRAKPIDQPGLRLRYNYTMTVWTRLYGLQLKWYFTFLEGRLKLAVSECEAKEQGRYLEAPLTISAERAQAGRLYPFPPLSEGEQAADWWGRKYYPFYRSTQTDCEYVAGANSMYGSVYPTEIKRVTHEVWQTLFPATHFYQVGFQSRHHSPYIADLHTYRLLAWQAGQGYEANSFDQLLTVNQITVTETNLEQVTQAFVLLTLGDAFTDGVRFSHTAPLNSDDTYALTVWIEKKQVKWQISFHQGQFQRAIREPKGPNDRGDYYYASHPQTEPEQVIAWWINHQYEIAKKIKAEQEERELRRKQRKPARKSDLKLRPEEAINWLDFQAIYPARADCLALTKIGQMRLCHSLKEIRQIDHLAWITLLPQFRFYHLELTQNTANIHEWYQPSYHLIAWQAGKGYEIEDVAKFLNIKGVTKNFDNQNLIDQAKTYFNENYREANLRASRKTGPRR